MSEYSTADIFEDNKLNQKTKWIGRGNQVALITSPQAGQKGFINRVDSSVRTEAGYVYDKHIFRKTANDAWYQNNMVETSGTLSTGAVGSDTTGTGDVLNFGIELTLPTTEKFYIITHLEFKSGQIGANHLVGLYTISTSLVIGSSSKAALVALAPEKITSPTTIYTLPCASKVLRGGQVLLPFIAGNGGNVTLVSGTEAQDRYYMTETYDSTPDYARNISVGAAAGSGRPYIKIYYYGYS